MAKLNIQAKWNYFRDTTLSIFQDIVMRQVDNRYLSLSGMIAVHGYDDEEKCIYLKPNDTLPLYCVSIAGESNMARQVDNLSSLATNHGYQLDAKMFLFYVKGKMLIDGDNDTFCSKQSIYMFTHSKGIANDIADYFETERLGPKEIVKALFDLGAITRYHNDENTFDVKSNFNWDKIPFDETSFAFKSIFADGVYGSITRDNKEMKSKHTLYQGLGVGSPLSTSPKIKEVMKLPWNGYIAITIDLNAKRIENYIDLKRRSTRGYEKNKEVKKAYKAISEELEVASSGIVATNIVALIDNPKVINGISDKLNIEFIEVEMFRKKIIYGTPITQKDASCDGLMFVEDCQQFITSIHKREMPSMDSTRNIYGKDISGNYISYSFRETGESPHWAIVAPTRSGKTFWIMKMVQSLIGAKIGAKTEEELESQLALNLSVNPSDKILSCSRLGENKIVQFDIGYSALNFAVEMKAKYPSDVVIFDDNLDLLRFGLTDIYYDYKENRINQEDMTSNIWTMDLILELNGEMPYTSSERTELVLAFERVFREDTYEGEEIYKLIEDGGYTEVVEQLKTTAESKGETFDKYTRTTELNLRGTKLDFMQKPLLSDILSSLSMKSSSTIVKEEEREACLRTYNKLKTIATSSIFKGYSQSNIIESNYFYMELEILKGLGEKVFLPVFLTVIQKLYRRDIKNAKKLKNPPKIIYILEEAHNLFKIPSLVKVGGFLEMTMRESARYNMQFGFITQDPNDTPALMLANIGNRIAMPSNRITGEKLDVKFWGKKQHEDISEEAKFYNENKEKYAAFINNGQGVTTITPLVTKAEARIFNSNKAKEREEEEIRAEAVLEAEIRERVQKEMEERK